MAKLDNAIHIYELKAEELDKSIDGYKHLQAKEYRQLVKWLKELKEYREKDINKN